MSTYNLPTLPLSNEIETNAVLRQATFAHRYLAELKGKAATIPNERILIDTLTLQEAKDSSAVENIITTEDELFKAELFANLQISVATKEVQNYAHALRHGFNLVRKNKILSINHILAIQQILEQNTAGFRKTPGVALVNQQTGETVYTPPQHPDEIIRLMDNLVSFINDENLSPLDPLVKMAIIHHQFESIHPFYDGNGRTGRIINILYLVLNDLLQLPILYLSRFVIKNKGEYYRLLQTVRDTEEWEEWLLFMLRGIAQTAQETILLVEKIKALMQDYKQRIRGEMPKIYSQDLLNNLFRHPYTKVEFVVQDLRVTRITATRYLDELVLRGFLLKKKMGKSNFYINQNLIQLLLTAHQ